MLLVVEFKYLLLLYLYFFITEIFMRLSCLAQALTFTTTAFLIIACDGDNNSDKDIVVRDVTPPLLTTNSDFGNSTTAIAASFVSGQVRDSGGIKSFTYQLNDRPAKPLTLDTDGKFTDTILLIAGNNKITLSATDNAGNITTSTKTIYLGDTIAAGGSHTGAIKDGQLYGWGRNNYGQTGLGSVTKLSDNNSVIQVHPDTPVKMNNSPNNLVSLSYNQNHSLAIAEDGRVYSWGEDKYGQLGRGDLSRDDCIRTKDCRLDILEIAGMSSAVMVATGYRHNLILSEDGSVWSMGLNSEGQLGDGTTTNRSTPVKVDFSATTDIGNIIQVVASSSSSYALDDKGQVWGWGSDYYANLGRGQECTTANNCINVTSKPILISSIQDVINGETVTQLAAGRDHVLALTDKESVYGWGLNASNQIGYTAKNPSVNGDVWGDVITSPTKLPWFTDKQVRRIYANGNASYVLLEDGKAYPWGVYGETDSAGKTSYSDLNEPTDKLQNMAAIDNMAMGALHQIAEEKSGELFTWAWSFEGSLGNKNTFNRWMYNTPIQVLLPTQP